MNDDRMTAAQIRYRPSWLANAQHAIGRPGARLSFLANVGLVVIAEVAESDPGLLVRAMAEVGATPRGDHNG